MRRGVHCPSTQYWQLLWHCANSDEVATRAKESTANASVVVRRNPRLVAPAWGLKFVDTLVSLPLCGLSVCRNMQEMFYKFRVAEGRQTVRLESKLTFRESLEYLNRLSAK